MKREEIPLDIVAELYDCGKRDQWQVAHAINRKYDTRFSGDTIGKVIRKARDNGDVRFPKRSNTGKNQKGIYVRSHI